MRRLLLLGMALGLGVITGCGGGDAPVLPDTAGGNEYQLTYFHWDITVPQSSGYEYLKLGSKLWMPQQAPRLYNLLQEIPYGQYNFSVLGPAIMPSTEGSNQTGVPINVFWGQGTTVGSGQPVVVWPQEWLPGYIRPTEPLYAYAGMTDLDQIAPVSGSYRLAGDGGFSRSWTIPGNQAMLETTPIVEPIVIVVNTTASFTIKWREVPGAAGYFVFIEGDIEDDDGNRVGMISWSCADKALVYDAVFDITPYLLPADTRQVTVPANVFKRCKAFQVNVLACTQPFIDASTEPEIHVLNGSLSTRIYVTATQ